MSQSDIEHLLNQLKKDNGTGAFRDWNNWSFQDYNLLLIHALKCTGCNVYCENMRAFWNHQRYCHISEPLPSCQTCTTIHMIYRFHVESCTNDKCEIRDEAELLINS